MQLKKHKAGQNPESFTGTWAEAQTTILKASLAVLNSWYRFWTEKKKRKILFNPTLRLKKVVEFWDQLW